MENNLPKINKKQSIEPGFHPPDVESIIRDFQLRILRHASRIPEDTRVCMQLVREFEWSSNWAESLATSLENDSRYLFRPEGHFPRCHEPETLIHLFQNENRLVSASLSQLKEEERAGMVERLKHYRITDIDNDLLNALYEACNWVIAESITEENCLRELETAQDAIHRAELFMMMGNDVEAYREFKNITPEESSNPDNTLILVDLFERYDSARAAIRILRKWFLLEIILHALPFDLVFDILSDRKKMDPSPRLRYLQTILLHSEEMSPDELRDHLILVMPAETTIIPDPADVDKRLKLFGLSLNSMDLVLDENESINLNSLLAGVIDQLLHLADLARGAGNEKLAVKALERAILGCFVLLTMPETDCDDFSGLEDSLFTHRIVGDYLDDIGEILDDLCVSSPSITQYPWIDRQITTLRNLIKKQAVDSILEEPDGMPGLPRKHGGH